MSARAHVMGLVCRPLEAPPIASVAYLFVLVFSSFSSAFLPSLVLSCASFVPISKKKSLDIFSVFRLRFSGRGKLICSAPMTTVTATTAEPRRRRPAIIHSVVREFNTSSRSIPQAYTHLPIYALLFFMAYNITFHSVFCFFSLKKIFFLSFL